jgi:hypothetical protein
VSRLDRITTDPRHLPWAADCARPALSGADAAGVLVVWDDVDEVLADYPDLEREDLLAALEFGALAAGGHRVVQLGAWSSRRCAASGAAGGRS